ncbi:MAG: response regulator [Myxococcota bacterium]
MNPSEISADSLLTSHQAGSLIQVNPSSINKWVKEGRIPAFRTPGGHRRIRAGDLVAFLNTHNMPVPRTLSPASRQRLLIVDDDAKQLASLERVLKPYASRIDVALCTNGIEALVKVGSFRPHMIVLDVYMPHLDGLEVCRKLRANAETQAIDVVMATAQLTSELEKKALEAGARRVMSKPVHVDVILSDLGIQTPVSAAS